MHSLNLSGCNNITDVSSLGQVHSLALTNTPVIDALAKLAPSQENNDKNLAILSQISHLELGNKKVEQMIHQMRWQTKTDGQKRPCVEQEQVKKYVRTTIEENQATDTATCSLSS